MIEEHHPVFAARFAVPSKAVTSTQSAEKQSQETLSFPRSRSQFTRRVSLSTSKPEPIASEAVAIVGISGHFPMAKDVDEFWRTLVEGKDCISEIPNDRWDWRTCITAIQKQKDNKTNIKWGGFIVGIGEFDPLFFGISPREAELMDPQQRLLMTYVWKTIEDAGYSAESLSGSKTAIFVGTQT